MEYLTNMNQSIYQGWILTMYFSIKYLEEKYQWNNDWKNTYTWKDVLQHTTNLEALVKVVRTCHYYNINFIQKDHKVQW